MDQLMHFYKVKLKLIDTTYFIMLKHSNQINDIYVINFH